MKLIKGTIILLGIISLVSCKPDPTGTSEGLAQECQMAVSGMKELTVNLEIPDHFKFSDHPEKQGGEFDVTEYFDVLSNLSMEPGFRLDYIYENDSLGGLPILYARSTEQTDTTAALLPYPEHIRATDTPEGYLELVIFNIMADQFYLLWHASYNDSQIICDKKTLNAAVSRLKNESHGTPLESKARKDAKMIDPNPVVILEDETAQVRVLIFTQWGGFIRRSYTVQRTFPHKILEFDSETLVSYNSEVMY